MLVINCQLFCKDFERFLLTLRKSRPRHKLTENPYAACNNIRSGVENNRSLDPVTNAQERDITPN